VIRQQFVGLLGQGRKQHDRVPGVKTAVVFAMTSGRSGTLSLSKLLKHGAAQCTVRHETNHNPWNPSMFGQAIYDHSSGCLDPVRALLRRKRRAIDACRTPVYVETSHAFLKSYVDVAAEFFPEAKLFHLIRDPREVARSEANRESWLNKQHNPLRHYRAPDGRLYRSWALTELEPIFDGFDLSELTLFQRYLIQWIEIENRAMNYLRRHDMAGRCLTLYTPQDLNSAEAAAAIVDFVGGRRAGEVALPGVHNRTPGYETVLGAGELSQCREVVAALPWRYLEIFEREPYARQPWAESLVG
jgi:hypothetical protein